MDSIQPGQTQNVKQTKIDSTINPNSKKVSVTKNEHCDSLTTKKENAYETLTCGLSEIYLTDKSLEERTIKFLEFVSTATKKSVINLPGSKHHGKSREKYIEEDQYLTSSKKDGAMDDSIRRCREKEKEYPPTNICTHGTNLYSFLIAAKTSDGYLLPLNKQIKRFGPAQAGEKRGNTMLNKKHVSTVGLGFYKSNFHDAIQYAEDNAECFSPSKLFVDQILNDYCPELELISKTYEILSAIPVVTVGYGISRGEVSSTISNEEVYKRMQVRTVAVLNTEIKTTLEKLLPEINPNRQFKVVLISELELIDHTERESYKDTPDYIKLGIIDPEN
jgi:hypothetical protein